MQEIDDREIQWLRKRSYCITASEVAKCFAKGKGKVLFGKGVETYISEKAMQIREGDLVEEINAYSLDWGKENEIYAIEWLKENSGMLRIVSGTNDDNDIAFATYANGKGGDSTDYFAYDGDELFAVGEIKAPSNKTKACNLTYPDYVTKAEVVDEYNYQFATHLIAYPKAKELHYCIYNGHENRITGAIYDRAVVFKYKREEFSGLIKQIEYRVPKIHDFIILCAKLEKKPSQINEWWEEMEY